MVFHKRQGHVDISFPILAVGAGGTAGWPKRVPGEANGRRFQKGSWMVIATLASVKDTGCDLRACSPMC